MKSSNIGTYKLSKQVGAKRWTEYLKEFGFIRKSGLDMGGEGRGFLADTWKTDEGQDLAVRPNMVIAAALEASPLDRAIHVVLLSRDVLGELIGADERDGNRAGVEGAHDHRRGRPRAGDRAA